MTRNRAMLVKMLESPNMTPAMAAGVPDRHWSMEDMVALVDAQAPKPANRGPYKNEGPSLMPIKDSAGRAA